MCTNVQEGERRCLLLGDVHAAKRLLEGDVLARQREMNDDYTRRDVRRETYRPNIPNSDLIISVPSSSVPCESTTRLVFNF